MDKVKLARERGFLISPKLLGIPDETFLEFLDFCEKNFKNEIILTDRHYREFLKSKERIEVKKAVKREVKRELKKKKNKSLDIPTLFSFTKTSKRIEKTKEEKKEEESLEEKYKEEVKEQGKKEEIESEKSKGEEEKIDLKKEVVVERSDVYQRSRDESEFGVKVIRSYENIGRKRDVKDFLMTFLDRYNRVKEILRGRINPLSIGNLSSKNNTDVEFVGMISEITRFKNSIAITFEDPTGFIRGVLTTKSPSWDIGEFLVEDIVVGVKGFKRGDTVFINEIIFPDIPNKKKKVVEDDVWAAFIGDFHFGSKMVLPKEMEMFLRFLKGEIGDEKTREIAGKIKYIVIPGDLVDGVGVYPNQKEELDVNDIYQQYDVASKFLEEVPDDKIIIISPGNHDAVGLAEPQPPLKKEFSSSLWERLGDRLVLVSNPSYVRIHSFGNGDGITTLIYHGYSFDRLIDRISAFRREGYSNSWKVMRYMLQVRHLAPFYGSTLQIPDKKDLLFIDTIPDIFVMGHIHYLSVGEYRGTHLVVSSTWQAPTSYQIMLGHEPQPGFVPLINLKDRRIRVLNFGG